MTNLLVLFANHPHLMHLGGAAALLVLFAAMQDEITNRDRCQLWCRWSRGDADPSGFTFVL